MTKKHFILIAAALCQTRPTGRAAKLQWRADRDAIMVALASTNVNFNKETFIAATERV